MSHTTMKAAVDMHILPVDRRTSNWFEGSSFVLCLLAVYDAKPSLVNWLVDAGKVSAPASAQIGEIHHECGHTVSLKSHLIAVVMKGVITIEAVPLDLEVFDEGRVVASTLKEVALFVIHCVIVSGLRVEDYKMRVLRSTR